ncbi:unnamed protein product [Protopolystoma xenopodis]|uniref:Dynein regulatory complex protein 9 n=1 Tax=Protopolystoma xenopodis TaxID=117903 RepID=A0A3S5CN69_9PLAT|nr:unnamed protein product [Protopolystoma xenopodis]
MQQVLLKERPPAQRRQVNSPPLSWSSSTEAIERARDWFNHSSMSPSPSPSPSSPFDPASLQFAPTERVAFEAVLCEACEELGLLWLLGKTRLPNTRTSTTSTPMATPTATATATATTRSSQALRRVTMSRRHTLGELTLEPDGEADGNRDSVAMKTLARVHACLRQAGVEVAGHGFVTGLEAHCDEAEALRRDEARALRSAADTSANIQRLCRHINRITNNLTRQQTELAAAAAHVKHEKQELREAVVMETAYLGHRFTACLHELAGRLNDQLTTVQTSIKSSQLRLDETTRNGEDVEQFLRQRSRLTATACAPDREQQSRRLTDHLDALTTRTRGQHERMRNLCDTIRHCEESVQAVHAVKEAAARRQAYLELSTRCALRIQAWWRTMLQVRQIALPRRRATQAGRRRAGKKRRSKSAKSTKA